MCLTGRLELHIAFNREIYCIELPSTATVADAVIELRNAADIKCDEIALLIAGKALCPADELADCGVTNEATLEALMDHVYIPVDEGVTLVSFVDPATLNNISFAPGKDEDHPIDYRVNNELRPPTRNLMWTGCSIRMPDIQRSVTVGREDVQRVLSGLRGLVQEVQRMGSGVVETNIDGYASIRAPPLLAQPPASIHITCGPGWGEFAGEYNRDDNDVANGAPLWCKGNWCLYRAPDLGWYIGRVGDDRSRAHGWISCHCAPGLLPTEVGKWRRVGQGGVWSDDAAITITCA